MTMTEFIICPGSDGFIDIGFCFPNRILTSSPFARKSSNCRGQSASGSVIVAGLYSLRSQSHKAVFFCEIKGKIPYRHFCYRDVRL